MEDAKLQLLLDRAEISDVQLRYATGLDSRDWPLFRSCFTDEIETDFTSVFGGDPRKVSADRWTEAARRSLSGLKATQHMITNHVITIAGDDATCIAYVQARHYPAQRVRRQHANHVRLLYESIRAHVRRMENSRSAS